MWHQFPEYGVEMKSSFHPKMQKRRPILLLLLLVIMGCASNDGVPGNIIPKDRMENILWDMIQADQFSNQYLIKDSSRINVKKETVKLYAEVLKIHNISKEEFKNSFQFYLGRPDLEKKMLDTLSERARKLKLATGPKSNFPKTK
jgi:Domain of unknown function (DUF4296)